MVAPFMKKILIWLVLYCCKHRVWKLADFGLTVEGSSRTKAYTRDARGTEGYRAPELLSAAHSNPVGYTNKVDIWAMGCILYELATGEAAFVTDYAVYEYRFSQKKMDIHLDVTFGENTIQTITNHIVHMLQIDSSARPSASVLSAEFRGECRRIELDDLTIEETEATMPDIQYAGAELGNSAPPLPLQLNGVSLHDAAGKGDIEAVALLLNAKVDVNQRGGLYGTALQAASFYGRETVVELLLNKGADVNAKEGYYGTALQAASCYGHGMVVELLLNKGADVNAKGGQYGTALQTASCWGHGMVVELLLNKGADFNAKGGFYGTVLQAASRYGDETVVELLLNKGADVNAKGGYYGTALQAASWHGHETVVELLLNKGADVNAQGGQYGTALMAATKGGYRSVAKLLEKNGATRY